MTNRNPLVRALILCLLSAPLAAVTHAADRFPDATDDGLTRIEAKKADAVYWRDGATLDQYSRILLLDCDVAFRKNWARDHNRKNRSLDSKVSDQDVMRIKAELAEEFGSVFEKELSEDGGFAVVDELADDVLVLQPAIVNLDVTAPDLRTASRTSSFVESAGAMTLVLAFYDGVTGDIIGRVVDDREDNRRGFAQRANSATNRAAADRILKSWAGSLRESLIEAGMTP
ncbi:MAG: DUF3313 family protein [Pseudomonadota bacterium]